MKDPPSQVLQISTQLHRLPPVTFQLAKASISETFFKSGAGVKSVGLCRLGLV